MSDKPDIERLADFVYEWACEEGLSEDDANSLADEVESDARDAVRRNRSN